MIEKSTAQDEPHVHFDQNANTVHRLLFEKGEKINPD